MIKRILGGLFIVFIFFNSTKAHSADSVPVIRCISVLPNGDVTVTWSVPNPADTVGSYFHYEVFAASSIFGMYNTIGTAAPFATPTFSYNNTVINSMPYYFYVVIDDTNPIGSTQAYDTVESIKLTVTNIGNHLITLNWNPLRTPNLPSSTGWYRIYKEYPTGVWTLKDSTQNLTYQDTTVLYCHQWLAYRVEIEDTSVYCTSVSTQDSVLIQDNVPPAPVTIDSVSVDPATGWIIIGWEPDTSQDTQGYTIYEYFAGGILSPYSTVNGINNTVDSFPNNNKLDSFIVIAFDSCGNLSSPSIIQTTIYVTSTSDACNDEIVMSWNPYINWADGVYQYYIYVNINGGPFTLLDSVSSSAFTYTDANLIQFDAYCFYIMAVDGGNHELTSRSNEVCITANMAAVPQFGYIETATVTGSSQVQLDLYTDISAQVLCYKLLRSVNPAGPFDTISTIGPNFISQFSMFDNSANTNDTSYYYCFVVFDNCDKITFTSNITRTILLKASSNPDMSNTLTWNDYSGFLGGVNTYNIYRSIDGIINPTPIASIPFGGTTTYKDYISNYVSSQGYFCYYIQALEGAGNPYFFTDTSLSNSACAFPDPLLFVPSAFSPDGGVNSVFLPVADFTDVHLYDLKIFTRWGDLIFESKTPSQGWDGTFRGDALQEDVFVWIIVLSGSGDTQITRTGTVTLIR